MPLLLGLDLGTSSIKAILAEPSGLIRASASHPYPLLTPRAGWSEQDPALWWDAAIAATRAALAAPGIRPADVAAIGLSGQMHGLVLLGESPPGPSPDHAARPVLRHAILWNDQRCAPQCADIERRLGGRPSLVRACGNAALPGFTAPKILWVRHHEPRLFADARLILLPKDYLRLRLTGRPALDVSDASGTMLVDPLSRTWSPAMLSALDLSPTLFPPILESAAPAGTLSPLAASLLGLTPGIPVAAGAGDNMAGAVGAGVVEPGLCLATIGTSGVIYSHSASPRIDLPADPALPAGRTHAFCAGDGDASNPGGYALTGCTLSAGGALQWLRDALFPDTPFDTLLAEAATVPPGCEGLAFLPYLSGERAPHPDPLARGAFVGLTLRHRRPHLVRAVLEGVTFTLAQILSIQQSLGARPPSIRLGGGGARSDLWRQLQADVFALPVTLTNTEEGPALGAAIFAGVAAGVFPSVPAACRQIIRETATITPRAPDAYAAPRAAFDRLYHDLRPAFADLARADSP